MPYEPEHQYERNFDETVVRYFSGRLPESDRRAFEAWVATAPARQAQVEQLRAVWEASAAVPAPAGSDADLEAALDAVKRRVRGRQGVRAASPVLRLQPAGVAARRSWHTIAWRIAAAVALLAGGTLLWHAGWPEAASARPMAAHRYTTGRGERLVVNLADGSVVTLHNESALDVPADFGAETRDVRLLRGEGYFEVAHDPARPFQVHSDRVITRVLGTKFSVRSRAGDESARVAVVEGRVAVGARAIGHDAPVLTAGQVARLNERDGIAIQGDVDVRRLLGWTSGQLIFDHTPVPEVLAELSRWFDRDFAVTDSTVAKLKLTTTLSGQSLAEAIAVLETSLEVRATVDGRRVELTARP